MIISGYANSCPRRQDGRGLDATVRRYNHSIVIRRDLRFSGNILKLPVGLMGRDINVESRIHQVVAMNGVSDRIYIDGVGPHFISETEGISKIISDINIPSRKRSVRLETGCRESHGLST